MRYILTLFVSLLLLASCDKAPINGDLDGLWQLTTIERLDADGNATESIRQKNIFWAFQLHLVQFGDNKYFGHFTNTGDSLHLCDLASVSPHENDGQNDEWLTEATIGELNPYGIYRLNPRFRIEKLNDGTMRLKNNDARLIFRKY